MHAQETMAQLLGTQHDSKGVGRHLTQLWQPLRTSSLDIQRQQVANHSRLSAPGGLLQPQNPANAFDAPQTTSTAAAPQGQLSTQRISVDPHLHALLPPTSEALMHVQSMYFTHVQAVSDLMTHLHQVSL